MQRLAGGFDGKRPMVVGHLHPVADDWVGNRHRGVAHGGNIVAAQKFFHRIDQRVVVVAGEHFDEFELLRRDFQREAGVGAADIGHQPRIGVRDG